jgi:hypothetical protein
MELFNLYDAPRASKLKIPFEMEGIWFHDNFPSRSPTHPPSGNGSLAAVLVGEAEKICAHEKYSNFMSIPSSRAQIRHMGRMNGNFYANHFIWRKPRSNLL